MSRPIVSLSIVSLLTASACTAYVPSQEESESSDSAIIHGTEDTGDMAVVRLHGKDDAPENLVQCTGTLIAPELVLTAAHCLSKEIAWVGFGLHGDELPVPAVQQLAHPNWSGNVDAGFDFGVVLLAGKLKDIAPIGFSSEPTDAPVGEQIRVVGFGNNVPDVDVPADDFGTGFGTKREATLAAAQVDETGQADQYFLKVLDDKGTQACLGDSGSPVFFKDASGVERIVAITSSARRGCQGTGSLHGRTWLVADWITDVLAFIAAQDATEQPATEQPATEQPAAEQPATEPTN